MPEGHQLAAIMFTDIVGYTSMMGNNERQALELLKTNRGIHTQTIRKFNGKLLKEMGDGILASFSSVSNAIEAACILQEQCHEVEQLKLRIGIHLGEVVFEHSDVYGDGVNIAARIQELAPAGGVLISEFVYRNISNKSRYQTRFLFEKALKNVAHPVKIYQVNSNENSTAKTANIQNSLAVLPFENMSNDPEQEYFCDGISEEIINTIVQIPEIKVAGRTSSFSFKGKHQDLRTIGQQLGVSNILEGSVRKFGNRVRITAQLIEASTGFHLWSNKYDRELDDIFEIQDEISLEIADKLQLTILGEKSIPKLRTHTQNIHAYQLYFKGRSLYYRRGTALFEALECFKLALQLDPDYALAASGLAETYIMLSFHGYLSPLECWDAAIKASEKAVKFGADLGETHNTLAVIALLHDRDLDKAETQFKLALEINPNHLQARVWYGLFFLIMARKEYVKGLSECKQAIINDPLSPYAYSCYTLGRAYSNQWENVVKQAQKAVDLDSKSWLSQYILAYCLQWTGDLDNAILKHKAGLDMSNRHSWQMGVLLQAYVQAEQKKQATALYSEMMRRYQERYFPPSIIAMASAAMGKSETALKFLQESVDIVDPHLLQVIGDIPESRQLRNIPGALSIIESGK